MSAIVEGIGLVIGKLAQQVQARIERLKNEVDTLLEERKKIMDGDPSDAGRDRVIVIDDRLSKIRKILENNAHD